MRALSAGDTRCPSTRRGRLGAADLPLGLLQTPEPGKEEKARSPGEGNFAT